MRNTRASRKKIAILCNDIFVIGGAQRCEMWLANTLSKYYQVDIIVKNSPPDTGLPAYPLSPNVRIYQMQNTGPTYWRYLKRILRILARKIKALDWRLAPYTVFLSSLRREYEMLLNKHRYTLVIASQSFCIGYLALVRTSARKIAWYHNSFKAEFHTRGRMGYKLGSLFRRLTAGFDTNVVLSKSAHEAYTRAFPGTFTYIYNAIHLAPTPRITSDPFFLFMGRTVMHHKGLDYLLDAYTQYMQHAEKPWKLEIVGEGRDFDALAEEIDARGLHDTITLHGFRKDVEYFYARAAVLLMPSRYEGMPLTFLEAASFGMPTIGFDIPVFKELIDGHRCGITVPYYDVGAYREAMQKISEDAALREELSEASREMSRHFSPDKIAQQWLTLIDRVIASA